LRMASPEERSHLIEYSVLAIFIHEALKERNRQKKTVNRPGLIAFLAASLIGLIDELIQLLIPARVFDPIDIFFNTFASFLAITTSTALAWARGKLTKKKE
ncbi:MAG: VanZ family protein, partial [Flavobacteriaceae bacterium]